MTEPVDGSRAGVGSDGAAAAGRARGDQGDGDQAASGRLVAGQAESDRAAIELALEEASAALSHGDVPVGAVVVGPDGSVLARRHNERELTGDPTAHAEVLALRDAAAAVDSWHLDGCGLYVTLEPCLMCAGAALNSRIDRIVYGAADPAAGACYSLYNVCDDPRLNHRIDLVSGVEAVRCGQLLTDFFAAKRSA